VLLCDGAALKPVAAVLLCDGAVLNPDGAVLLCDVAVPLVEPNPLMSEHFAAFVPQ
jgi:hypothetical protein